MCSEKVKKPIAEWELEDAIKFNNDSTKLLDDCIESCYNQFIKLIKYKQDFEYQNSLLEYREMENTHKDLVEIVEYEKDELVSFTTKLFPINYYKLESYKYNVELKNMIIYSISDKLKEINFKESNGEVINQWDKAILLIQLKKDGQATDFDNYFCKPFVDGIKKSRFIKDDNPECLNIAYSNLDSENQLIKLTLINRKYHKKYADKIHEILIN
ncbi:MAG: hypothetical protein E7F55_12885 [Clostridium perfringens]|nr:hypothetical protein [Clostridium perfringens]